jgi:hypothetical protein
MVSASMWALSARQLANPYCFARSNCASASFAPGLLCRSSARRVFASLRSQSRLGWSGSMGSRTETFLSRERDAPCRTARGPHVGRGIRRLFVNDCRVGSTLYADRGPPFTARSRSQRRWWRDPRRVRDLIRSLVLHPQVARAKRRREAQPHTGRKVAARGTPWRRRLKCRMS